jgi:hypothetical protein
MIVNYKTITVAATLTSTNTFSVPIHLPFVPSHVIIKQISIANNSISDSNDLVLLLRSSLINNHIIYHFARNPSDLITISHSTSLKFKMNPIQINGSYDFYFTDIAGNIPDQIDDTVIQIALTMCFEEERLI